MSETPWRLLGGALLLGAVVTVVVYWQRDSGRDVAPVVQSTAVPVTSLPERESPRTPASAARDATVAPLPSTLWSALQHAQAAERAGPANPDRSALVGELLAALRAFPEARAAFDRALALAPTRHDLVASKVATFQAEGDLLAADALIQKLPPARPGEPEAVAVRHRQLLYQRRHAEAVTLLDDVFGQAARAKTANGWVRLNFHIEVGRLRELLGHTTATSEFQLALHLDGELRAAGFDAARLASVLGRIHAGLGNAAQAIGAARDYLAAVTDDQPARQAALLQLAEIHARFGDAPAALALLSESLASPFGTTPAALRLDPAWATLRGNAQFDALSAPPD